MRLNEWYYRMNLNPSQATIPSTLPSENKSCNGCNSASDLQKVNPKPASVTTKKLLHGLFLQNKYADRRQIPSSELLPSFSNIKSSEG